MNYKFIHSKFTHSLIQNFKHDTGKNSYGRGTQGEI